MGQRADSVMRWCVLAAAAVMFGCFLYVVWIWVPQADIRVALLGLCGGLCLTGVLWSLWQRRQLCKFADELCRTLDDLIAERKPQDYFPYEDTLTARIQGKLMQYYDLMSEGRRQSRQDKQIIQELVSDISHQVKTPMANLQMFMGILQSHDLRDRKSVV